MPVTAVTYGIRPGHEDEIAEIFGSFRRVNGSPVVRDARGAILRFMASQPGVQELERRLAPFLAGPRDTATPEDFVATFHRNELRCVSQLSVDR